MNFAKGIMIGTLATVGVMWMYTKNPMQDNKKMIKKGKKFIKQMGF